VDYISSLGFFNEYGTFKHEYDTVHEYSLVLFYFLLRAYSFSVFHPQKKSINVYSLSQVPDQGFIIGIRSTRDFANISTALLIALLEILY